MSQPCGCCEGIQIVTPEPEANRPGLSAIAYRVGTHATFFESMLARLSSLYLDVPAPDGSGAIERIYPLKALTTRDVSDPSIALLDAWATVADVLTFYQERIANEGYLLTATERRSILELAKLVGYKLRPGVSASVFLAFTVANAFKGTIPAGTRAQSIPGTGELPQFFETSYDLAARDVWNNLKPRLTRPQIITLASNPITHKPATIDQGTDATTRDTLYFQGISTNLKAGDALLIVSGDGQGQQFLRLVQSVDVQADQNRTEIVLQEADPNTYVHTTGVQAAVSSAVQPFVTDASAIFAGSVLANQVADLLQEQILANVQSSTSGTTAASMIQAVIPQVQTIRDIAAKRKFTRLEAWIAHILDVLAWLVQQLPSLKVEGTGGGTGGGSAETALAGTVSLAPSSLANLFGILDQLALPPSLQPANPQRLARTIAQTFSPQADAAPRLLAAFNPAVANMLYKAWAGIATPSSQVQVYAMRISASLFGSNAPPRITGVDNGVVTSYDDWPLAVTPVDASGALVTGATPVPSEDPSSVSLGASHQQIESGSWVAVDTSAVDTSKTKVIKSPGLLYARAGVVKAGVSRAAYGMSGQTTRIPLLDPASSEPTNWLDLSNAVADKGTDFIAIRETVVYAQAERLELAEEPLDRDVGGNTIELDSLYDGLETGRWIIVSGERTDIPNTTRVTASELVMVAAVTEGPGKQSCMGITLKAVPFASVYYVTGPNDAGDRLVVGRPNPGGPPIQQLLSAFPLPNVPGGNQQICHPIELAPGLYANAYVPTPAERNGDFSAFAASLQDPSPGSGPPISGGVIPLPRWGDVFAWRITSIASGQDTLHTTLVLANSLAYTYDSSTVTIYGNVAKATHGQTVGEVLGNGDGSQALQKFALHQSPLTYVSAPTPAGAQSTLVVRVNDIEWHEADNLAELGPRDRSYITATDDADKTSVIFGNGEHGARLPTGAANVKSVYRYGIGKPGNVKAEQISQLATRPLGAKGVNNPLPATGGADRDSRDQARGNAPLAVEALDRLVSVKDYADFARTFAGIGKASSARLSDGRRIVVHVTIAGADDIPIDRNSDLFQNLVQALHQNGDPYQPIQVEVRKLELLVISAGVKVLPDYQWESVEPKVRAALLAKFGFDQRALGQSAFLSEAVSVMQGVEGVSYVNVQTFDAVPEDVTPEHLASLTDPNSSLRLQLRPFVEADLAHVDSTATDPTKRIVPAELAILTPDIPDTLILTQITT